MNSSIVKARRREVTQIRSSSAHPRIFQRGRPPIRVSANLLFDHYLTKTFHRDKGDGRVRARNTKRCTGGQCDQCDRAFKYNVSLKENTETHRRN